MYICEVKEKYMNFIQTYKHLYQILDRYTYITHSDMYSICKNK